MSVTIYSPTIHCDSLAVNDLSFLERSVIEFLLKEDKLAADIYGQIHRVHRDAWMGTSRRWVKHFKEASRLHPQDGGSKVLRTVGILPHQHNVSQPSEDGDSKVPRNVGTIPQRYTASELKVPCL